MSVTRLLRAVLKLAVAVYAVAILGFVWLTKDLTFATLTRDPLFASYSVAVVLYVLGRFALALFYRSVPDRGHRPTVSIIVPRSTRRTGSSPPSPRASPSTTRPRSSR